MNLNSPDRIHEIRSRILDKKSLRLLYLEGYTKYKQSLALCPAGGIALELGSGGGFIKEVIPEATTSDLLPYEGVDQVVDACKMPLQDQSIRAIFMSNVFHHITDAEAFFQEATRCLVPGGRIFISDPYCGWFGSIIYRYIHHEPFDPNAREWKFQSTGPLSGANIALAGIVFERDLDLFKTRFPQLKLVKYEPNTPLRYWLSGGLKTWTLLPAWAFPLATWLDRFLVKLSPGFSSFVDIEIERI